MAERNLSVDHVTIWRWVQRYAPVLNQRIRREMRHPNRSWRVDETYIKIAGSWAYLYRAVDSAGETIEFMLSPKRDLIAAKLFLRLALSRGGPRPRVINVDGHPAYASAIAELKQTGELGCVASTVFKEFPDLVKMLEGPPIGHLSKTIKHAVCSEYCRCNTSV
jgi:transposase-like protein